MLDMLVNMTSLAVTPRLLNRRSPPVLAVAALVPGWTAISLLELLSAPLSQRPRLVRPGPPSDIYEIHRDGLAVEEMHIVWEVPLMSVMHRLNGKLHRTGDLPAVEVFHRENGVLILQNYYWQGQHHRAGGKPASIGYHHETGERTDTLYYEYGKYMGRA